MSHIYIYSQPTTTLSNLALHLVKRTLASTASMIVVSSLIFCLSKLLFSLSTRGFSCQGRSSVSKRILKEQEEERKKKKQEEEEQKAAKQ
jgi:hypothetical protein